MPTLSAHNIVAGTPYVDIGGNQEIKIIENPDLVCKLTYFKQSLWGGPANHYKVEGFVSENGQQKYKVHGNWNSKIFVTKIEGGKLDKLSEICVFDKTPYPENWKLMYGMSHFSL